MKNKGYLMLASVALALLATTAVRADVGLAYCGVTPGVDVSFYYNYGTGVRQQATRAGAYRHFIEQPIPDILNAPEVPVALFCLDLVSYTEPQGGLQATGPYPAIGSAYYTDYALVAPELAPQPDGSTAHFPMGDTRALWLSALAAQEWPSLDGLPGHDGYSEAEEYGAMQMAIWEIIYQDQTSWDNPSWDVTAGNFQVYGGDDDASNARTLANIMLTTLRANIGAGGYATAYLGALVNDTYQDMLVRTTGIVPEPSALALAGFGLLGFFVRRRKRS
jgi:hypothetical protein